jgi:hypothetical protein
MVVKVPGGATLRDMTLIVTQFSQYGIVLAADSNISTGSNVLGVRRKVLRIPAISAGLAYSGGFGVNGRSLDEWMHNFIETEQGTYSSLRDFCDLLVERLNAERTSADKAKRVIAHVAGWVGDVPTMWHISNVELLLEQGGRYSDPVPNLTVRGPDFAEPQWKDFLAAPQAQMPLAFFVNGPVQGRIAYNTHEEQIMNWLRSLWQAQELPFRAPESIEEQEDVVRTSMEVMRLLFRMSPMSATIGGAIQSVAISAATVGDVCLVTEAVPDHLAKSTGRASVDDD